MNDEKSFLDKRTIVAIVVMTVIWIGWQTYISKKYGRDDAGPVGPTVAADNATPSKSLPSSPVPGADKGASLDSKLGVGDSSNLKQPDAEQFLIIEDDVWKFEVSNYGMAVRNVYLKKYKDRDGQPIHLATLPGEFGTEIIGSNQPLVFDLSRNGEQITGRAKVGQVSIVKTYKIASSKYLLDSTVEVTGIGPGFVGLRSSMRDAVKPVSKSFLMPSMEHQNVYISHGTTSTRKNLAADAKGNLHEKVEAVGVASLGSLYFASAIVDSSEILPSAVTTYVDNSGETQVKVDMDYLLPAGLAQAELKYKAFIGPKELRLLQSIDSRLESLIDYWIVGALAKPMLKLLLWIQSWVGNWGAAIILLTLLIRSLVLPLYISSFKSMKAMQKIQPQMQDVRAKYASDPQKMNQEVMKLFKDNKVNPLGGCLPMLLQLPIFIALYRVLSQSIELYQAPFIFWIHDLSLKDPFFVLPVLMGISMFIQQKITPTSTTDPMQQKVLLWMPVIFSGMMLTLPSGLTLYILISTVFGISQHYIFMRDKTPATVPAKA